MKLNKDPRLRYQDRPGATRMTVVTLLCVGSAWEPEELGRDLPLGWLQLHHREKDRVTAQVTCGHHPSTSSMT